MALKLITAPAYEPVTLAEAKAQCSVADDFTADDALLSSMIAAARGQAEHLTGRTIPAQGLELVLPEFPRVRWLELPRPPLVAVEAVTYLDHGDQEQAMDTADYRVDIDSMVGRIYAAEWPETVRGRHDAVRIRYTAGWPMSEPGGEYPAVWTGPTEIKQWLLIRVASLYAQRESFIVGTIKTEMGRSFVGGLLDAYRVPGGM